MMIAQVTNYDKLAEKLAELTAMLETYPVQATSYGEAVRLLDALELAIEQYEDVL